MAIELFKHNKIAYKKAVKMLREKGKAAVIHPTGTGKTFIAFKLLEDYPERNFCWLSPSEYIYKTQIENIGGMEFENLNFLTYQKLSYMEKEEIDELKPDVIILDEMHRCGASIWEKNVRYLLEKFPDAWVLGLSATNIRYLDNRRDMADELFDGNVASYMSLGEAIVTGILKAPLYVLTMFSYQKDLEKFQRKIARTSNRTAAQNAEVYLAALKRKLENADGLDDIFHKYLQKDGKYIVFCSHYQHMKEMCENADRWFEKVDSEYHIYTAYSNAAETSKEFAEFKEDTSEHLKLLFCIDMLNEGIHINGISGVILFRPTESPIVYKQQIGRALSTNGVEHPLIIDVVDNINGLSVMNDVKAEMENALFVYEYERGENADSLDIVNDHYEVVDEVADCRVLFEKIDDILAMPFEVMYEQAKQYYQEHGNLEVPQRYYTETGYPLGAWIYRTRQKGIKGELSQEQIKMLDKLKMRWEVSVYRFDDYLQALKNYRKKYGDLFVPVDYCVGSMSLGRWVQRIRKYGKKGASNQNYNQENIEKLDQIGFVWDVKEYQWENGFRYLQEYYEKNGTVNNIPIKFVTQDGYRLGEFTNKIRKDHKKGKLSEDRIKQLRSLDFNFTGRNKISLEIGYEHAKAYFEEHGKMPVAGYVCEDGFELGKWVVSQRHSRKQDKEYIEKLRKIGIEVLVPEKMEWDLFIETAKKYYQKYKKLSQAAKQDGWEIGYWFFHYKKKYFAGELTEQQMRDLESIGMILENDPGDKDFQKSYAIAKQYYERHGTVNISPFTVDENGNRVGYWIGKQKSDYRKGRMKEERIALLEKLNIDWRSGDQISFDEKYEFAKAYYDQHGNLNISHRYITENGVHLGEWLFRQLVKARDHQLKSWEIEKLQTIGFVFDENGELREKAG